MMQRSLAVALLAAATFSQTSCKGQGNNGGFATTKNGLQYRIVTDAPGGQKPAVGDFVEMHINTHIGDSVLMNSRQMNNNQPVPLQVTPPSFNGDLMEGLTMLTEGDSAIFRISVDSLLKMGNQPLPWIKAGVGQMVEYEVKMTSVRNQQQMKQQQEVAAAKQKGIDEGILQSYFATNNIKPTKTASGMYYRVTKQGTGAAPKAGQKVTVNYTGKTLDGNTFDSNVDPKFNHVQPFQFVLGMGQVIKGWDEGIALLKKGSKATLYIPSTLAYGAQSPSPAIPANGILMFDVELVNFEAAAAPGAPQPGVAPKKMPSRPATPAKKK